MDDRSSRRMRTPVTRMAHGGLSAKKNACALISMMARSTTRSNLRSDTLMQDRSPPWDDVRYTSVFGKKDGVIGRPSLWIAEDFGCCASG